MRQLNSTYPVLLLLLAACGGDESSDAKGQNAGDPDSGAGAAQAPTRTKRSDDPRVEQLRRALDEGDVDLAQALIEQAAGLAGPVEGPLLRARLAAYLPGGTLASARLLEQARQASHDDPRIAATSIELYAWGGQINEAEDELRRAGAGMDSRNLPPEILRAYGITHLCTPGAAPRQGLSLIEQALAADPDLPFVKRALGQAHLLVAKELAGVGDSEAALEAVDRSLSFDPDDLPTIRMRAELLTALGEWGEALRIYDDLITEGLELEGEAADLYQRASVVARVRMRKPDLAERYLLRAFELGFPRASLGGTHELIAVGAADSRAEAGGTKLEAGELEPALVLLDPDCLAARYLRGLLYQRRAAKGDFDRVVVEWEYVISVARLTSIELPQDVHIDLARHQVLGLDDLEGAHETLQAYLLFEPEGKFVEKTRDLLNKLPPLPRVEDDIDTDGPGDAGEAVEDGGPG
ncbi:MAG: hypothetical protein O2816_16380 [Planctomycetota bacterium]|nr:hypothetical protein [Planctomycetota bacterium]